MTYEREMLRWVETHFEEARQDFHGIRQEIGNSALCYRNRCVQSLAVPKVYSRRDAALMDEFVAGCFAVFRKVIDRYLADGAYRRLFPFPPELERLILLPAQYGCRVPMARVDFFFDEVTKAVKLCEVNTDGASAMNEDRILGGLLGKNRAYQSFAETHGCRPFELFDSWAGEFLSLCREHSPSGGPPFVAIADFLEKATLPEFRQFALAFEQRGMRAEICDIRDIRYEGGRLLTPRGDAIDAVYRRAVTSDIMANAADVRPFLQGALDGAACLVGGFRTQVIHNKALFGVLHREETLSFLAPEERAFVLRHVPLTYPLLPAHIEKHNALAEKDRWIIKPYDSYGSRGVYAGLDCGQGEWERLVGSCAGDGYLMQEYCAPYRSANVDFTDAQPKERPFCNITGVFCYNERPYGIYSRLSKGNVISSQYDEKSVATLVCEEG
ncbi:MAG: glutathionylspermidine synthase family protein [Oscillospiraceae bacterium]|jgi:glutathionylspermidine synthase|nr:glutathionylspermidine synthase family protein [Oscillospiraceae bacterium]